MSGSFLFPRTVSITRPPTAVPPAGGSQPYSALDKTQESAVVSGLAARIEIWRIGAKPRENLPADAPTQPLWKILLSWTNVPSPGTIQLRDVVTDDAGMRYQVVSAEYETIGWRLIAQQLTV